LFGSVILGCQFKTQKKSNLLFIAVDDLNDWVPCMKGHPNVNIPHIDRLANRSILFNNAFCQAPVCNPSRTSIIFGIRPSSSGFYGNSHISAKDFKEVVGPRPGQSNDYDEPVYRNRINMHPLWDFEPQTYNEGKYLDYIDASWALGKLQENYESPFLLEIGFYRPYVPFFAPIRKFEELPIIA